MYNETSMASEMISGLDLLSSVLNYAKLGKNCVELGCAAIDSLALDGGFRYGEITTIAGSNGTGKTLLAFHALVSYLLHIDQGQVAFIDTSGSFSPMRIRDVIISRLRTMDQSANVKHTGYVYGRFPSRKESGIQEELKWKATQMLDRIKVMRAFDFTGIVEAIGEVSATQDYRLHSKDTRIANEFQAASGENQEIADSDEESERDEIHAARSPIFANVENKRLKEIGGVGQALLTTFMRSLQQLTSQHKTCTLLINSVVGLNPSANASYQQRLEDNVSIFASTPGKPALGKTFAHLIDTSIFLSRVPKTRDDAEFACANTTSGGIDWKSVGVLEVLKDRNGIREGRWAAFEVVDGVQLEGPGG